jgi:CheY-like chemotaxis protein
MLQAQNVHLPVIVMSAFGTVEIAVEAMKKGAVDFSPKPFSLDHLGRGREESSWKSASCATRIASCGKPWASATSLKTSSGKRRDAGDFSDNHTRGAARALRSCSPGKAASAKT